MLLVTEWAVICIYYWARSKQYHIWLAELEWKERYCARWGDPL